MYLVANNGICNRDSYNNMGCYKCYNFNQRRVWNTKLSKSLNRLFIKVLIFLDLHFLRNKDLECRISYGSGYMDKGSFKNRLLEEKEFKIMGNNEFIYIRILERREWLKMRKYVKMEVLYWLKFSFIGFLIVIAPMLACLFLFEHILASLAYSIYISCLILCSVYIFCKSDEENKSRKEKSLGFLKDDSKS